MSKWDDKSAASSTTDWGKKWRAVVKAVLPKDGNGGVTCSDPEVQKLCLAMWRDLSSWAAEECRQHLMLFQADEQGDAEETQWAFVPATDLLLLVGEGLVGCAAEGFAVQADEGHTRIGFVDALKNWRSSLRKNRSAGKETSDSAVKLWQAAKREAQKMDKEEENKESKERNGHESGSKKSKTCDEPEEIKLNRSPTKVLLLTNLVPPTLEEDEIQSIAEKLVEDFGKIHECKILKVADVPEEDAVRVFLLFDSVQVSSKAYTALKGQVREGRALRARFYDERRFQDGDLQKSVPSRVVLLSGLVNLEELDGGLKDEVISLAEKAAGRPLKCVIQTTELPGDEAVRVFLDFETVDDAVKAVSQLHGQEFGLRRIRARYSTEELKPQSSRGAERN